MRAKWEERNERMYEPVRTFENHGNATEHASEPLESWTFVELRNRARQLHVSGRSTMNKDELVEAIRSRNQARSRN